MEAGRDRKRGAAPVPGPLAAMLQVLGILSIIQKSSGATKCLLEPPGISMDQDLVWPRISTLEELWKRYKLN